ncbi:MAG: AzlD domain-containing protein [Chlamydiales bacterium]
MREWYILLPVVTAVSMGTRLLPFVFGSIFLKWKFLEKLSTVLPICLLIFIMAHTLQQGDLVHKEEAAALMAVLATQYFFRSLVLSMCAGVVVHQILLHL